MENLSDWLETVKAIGPGEEVVENSKSEKDRVDLFNRVLPAMEKGDLGFYGRLTEAQRRSVEPWMMMRWATSTYNDHDQVGRLYLVNDLVNRNFQTLSPRKTLGQAGHAELQWMLLVMACRGRKLNYRFIYPPKVERRRDPLSEYIRERFPAWNEDELGLFLSINSREDLESWLKENGLSDREISELF